MGIWLELHANTQQPCTGPKPVYNKHSDTWSYDPCDGKYCTICGGSQVVMKRKRSDSPPSGPYPDVEAAIEAIREYIGSKEKHVVSEYIAYGPQYAERRKQNLLPTIFLVDKSAGHTGEWSEDKCMESATSSIVITCPDKVAHKMMSKLKEFF